MILLSIFPNENADQNNFEHEHFSRSDCFINEIFAKEVVF